MHKSKLKIFRIHFLSPKQFSHLHMNRPQTELIPQLGSFTIEEYDLLSA